MTLRLRLFALLVALAALLAVGEWALVRALSSDLEEELASAAATVSQDVLRLLESDGVPPPPPAAGANGRPERIERRVFVLKGPARGDAPRKPEGSGEGAPVKPVQPSLLDPPADPAPSPGTGIARGVVELRSVTADGSMLTERHEIERRLDPGSNAHVLLLHGPQSAQQVPVPTSGVEHAVDRFSRHLLLASLALFGSALALGVVGTHRFTRPLRDLAAAARRVGQGDLGVRAPAAPGEVGEAVAAFNQMSQQLLTLDAETRRLRASEQLSELGEVGRGLAHGLRNPLNALGLALDQLAEHATTGAGGGAATGSDPAAVAAAARRQIRRIDAALRGFLALSAADAAAMEVDLVAVARDVALEALQTRPAGEAAARVEVVAAAGPVRLAGVEAELRAALQALVVNAVEASPPGAAVVVTVEPARRVPPGEAGGEGGGEGEPVLANAGAQITVDDAGPGVPAAVRDKLFTPHVTTKAAGAGIGLYLAHRLATTRYAGELTLEDRDGGGTRARLLLRGRGSVAGHTGSVEGNGDSAAGDTGAVGAGGGPAVGR